jgi:hypothetical protein
MMPHGIARRQKRAGTYDMNAATIALELHERGIHAV